MVPLYRSPRTTCYMASTLASFCYNKFVFFGKIVESLRCCLTSRHTSEDVTRYSSAMSFWGRKSTRYALTISAYSFTDRSLSLRFFISRYEALSSLNCSCSSFSMRPAGLLAFVECLRSRLERALMLK